MAFVNIIQKSCTLRCFLSLNFRITSSNEIVFSLLCSKAKNARFRIRLLVIDSRHGIFMLANAENDASHTAVLHANVSIIAYVSYTFGNASRTSYNVVRMLNGISFLSTSFAQSFFLFST